MSKGWTEDRSNLAINEYKKFVFLAKNQNPGDYLSPPGDVDDIWHEHILHTKDYHNDTNDYFGKYFHHNPYDVSEYKSYQFDKYGSKYNKYFEKDGFMKMFHINQKKLEVCVNEKCRSNCQVCTPDQICNT